MLGLVLILISCGLLGYSEERPKTLGAFKQTFLNQQIVINDVPFDESVCLQWETAEQSGDTYSATRGFSNHLPIKYRGQSATVVAVQLAESFFQKTQIGATNAFGESTTDNELVDPYLEVVVRFGDGKLAIVRGFPNTLVPSEMELATARKTLRDELGVCRA